MKEIALKIGENKQTITIYHDESTVHANEQPSQAWLLPNTSGFWSKSAGRMIHIFNSILETTSTGRMVIESNHIESKRDADVVIYPGAKGDKWWACNQLIKQVQTKAIPIFEKLHPSAQAVLNLWLFFGTRVIRPFSFAIAKHEFWTRWQERPYLGHQNTWWWSPDLISHPRPSSENEPSVWSPRSNTSRSTKRCPADPHQTRTLGSLQYLKQEVWKLAAYLSTCVVQTIWHCSRC